MSYPLIDPTGQFKVGQSAVRYRPAQDFGAFRAGASYRVSVIGFDAEQPEMFVWVRDLSGREWLVQRAALDQPITDGWGNWMPATTLDAGRPGA